jgi:flagellar protein FliS
MMPPRSAAQRYHAVRSQGQIADASPTRVVQIMFEHILSHLATAQACMERLHDNLPLSDLTAKCSAIAKAVRLIGQLDASLDMDRGGEIAANLHNLYLYMLGRLTTANARNDASIVAEVAILVRTIKTGWDKLVVVAR